MTVILQPQLLNIQLAINAHACWADLRLDKIPGIAPPADARHAQVSENRSDIGLSQLFLAIFLRPIPATLPSQRGMRQAPECLVPGHISVRSRELFKRKGIMLNGKRQMNCSCSVSFSQVQIQIAMQVHFDPADLLADSSNQG
ncbi:MAG: hypothetical protein Q4G29_00890 [Pseudoscardovia radai]|nr:hypothetical protein [Pseudoscardovia radai]